MTLTFFIILLLVAIVYAAVGHGGASGYLALMAVYGFAPEIMKPTALVLNIFVSLTSFILFYKAGHFNWKLFLPLGIASIPLSFLGGTITLDALLYKKILGILLLLTVIRFYIKSDEPEKKVNDVSLYLAVLVGAVIGLVSGIIGVGGGILLSPVLLMLHWSDQKQTAAISALFIFVNSMSGLAGQATQGIQFVPEMFVFVAVVFAGGLMGGWLGSFRATQKVLGYTLSAVLMLASYKLLCT